MGHWLGLQALEMGALQKKAAEHPHQSPGTVLAWEASFPSSLSGKEKPLSIYLNPHIQQGQVAVLPQLTEMLIYSLRNGGL